MIGLYMHSFVINYNKLLRDQLVRKFIGIRYRS